MKFTSSALLLFIREYRKGKYPQERLGQAFINHMLPHDYLNPSLFYANDQRASEIIWQDFLDK